MFRSPEREAFLRAALRSLRPGRARAAVVLPFRRAQVFRDEQCEYCEQEQAFPYSQPPVHCEYEQGAERDDQQRGLGHKLPAWQGKRHEQDADAQDQARVRRH